MTTCRALWALIGISTLLRLAWAACLGADTNEAYYYLYAQHLDWSYFDHPPMVAVVSAVGLRLVGDAAPVLGLRAGFLAMFAASTWLMARLTARAFGPRAGVLAALALNVSAYFGLVVGTSASPDGPLLFFWLLALDRLAVALAEPGRIGAWLGAGAAMGGALLSKYYAALLPVGVVLFLALRPSSRRCLRGPGPYLALAVSLAAFAPVIGWNATHRWISFRFQSGRAVGSHGLHPEYLAEAVGAEALFLFPWIWLALVLILVRLLRRGPRAWSEPEAFLACQAAPTLLLFHGVATVRGILPHWPMIGYVALMPLLGRSWSALAPGRLRRVVIALIVAPALIATAIVFQARLGLLQDRRGMAFGAIPAAADPTVELIVWDQVARELARRGLPGADGTFLVTDSWRRSAQLSFATRAKVPVACYAADARSFAFWSRPEDWVGRDGILVTVGDDRAGARAIGRRFARVESLGSFAIRRAGVPVQTIRLDRCIRQVEPFPFRYRGQ